MFEMLANSVSARIMYRVECTLCGQKFPSKRGFVQHRVSKLCLPSRCLTRRSRTRETGNTTSLSSYPTLEIVPRQDCPACRRYSKPGLQIYMLSHLATHVIMSGAAAEARLQPGGAAVTRPQKETVTVQTTGPELKDKDSKREISQTELETYGCSQCDMEFDLPTTLEDHQRLLHTSE